MPAHKILLRAPAARVTNHLRSKPLDESVCRHHNTLSFDGLRILCGISLMKPLECRQPVQGGNDVGRDQGK